MSQIPSRDQILQWITDNPTQTAKRDIARAFGIKGAARIDLKAILRESGIPVWDRAALPLIFCGDRLVAVPGVGIDADFRAPAGKPGVTLSWHPRQY